MSGPAASFYDAKRALLDAARADMADDAHRGRGRVFGGDAYVITHERTVDAILATLGWEVPGPALDGKGKPVKVYADDVRLVLPKGWEAAHPLRQVVGRQRNWRYTGYVIAASKREAALVTSTSERMAARTARNIGEPIGPTDLAYAAAVAAGPDNIVVNVNNTFHVIPRADLCNALNGDPR